MCRSRGSWLWALVFVLDTTGRHGSLEERTPSVQACAAAAMCPEAPSDPDVPNLQSSAQLMTTETDATVTAVRFTSRHHADRTLPHR